MISDFKILSLWFVIEYWWYNTLTCENNWFLNVLVKSNFATPTTCGRVSFFVVGICLSNYNLNSFLIHQASYSKGYQWYLMLREVLGSIRKIGRYPIKVSEVLVYIFLTISFNMFFGCSKEPYHWDSSFEYPQHMFWSKNKKFVFLLHTFNKMPV